MDKKQTIGTVDNSRKSTEAPLEDVIGEELTDEQLLQMAEGSCSWGANCNKGCSGSG